MPLPERAEEIQGELGVRDFPGRGSDITVDLFEQKRTWWQRYSTPSGGVSGFPGHGSEEVENSGGVSGFPGHGLSGSQ